MKNKILSISVVMMAMVFILSPVSAFAAVSSGGATASSGLSGAFSTLWTDIADLFTGYAGMIIAAGLLIMGIIESKKHPMFFFFGLILAAVIFMVPTITQSIASATFTAPATAGSYSAFNIAAYAVLAVALAFSAVRKIGKRVGKRKI